ncbi:MAG: hypothetical protein NXI27_02035 [Alphaproteobacteria bacterium]|nr:hypothetical protein [Alphaproteobacteria bacterium]
MMNAPRERLKFHDPVSAQAEVDRRLRERELRQSMLDAASRDAPGDSRWFVLSVANRREIEVADALEAKNICAWVPMKTTQIIRRRGRMSDGKSVPIFTGYVFVQVVACAHAFLGLLSVDHVQALLGSGEQPIPVRHEIMCALKELVEGDAFEDDARSAMRSKFKPGDMVEINHGVFSFVTAVVSGYRGTRHVRCMAELFGGKTVVDVPLANLEKIG